VRELLLGSAAACVAGVIQGCAGFGLGLVATPFLLFVFPPAAAVPIIRLIGVFSTAFIACKARRHIVLGLAGRLIAGGVAGLPIGILALKTLPSAPVKLFIGALVAVLAALMLLGWSRPVKNTRQALFPVGVLSGILGGLSSMSAPPIVLFLSNQGMAKDQFRANIVFYLFITTLGGAVMDAAAGLTTARVLVAAIVFIPAMLTGAVIGICMAERVPEGSFWKLVEVMLLAIGLIHAGKGILSLAAGS